MMRIRNFTGIEWNNVKKYCTQYSDMESVVTKFKMRDTGKLVHGIKKEGYTEKHGNYHAVIAEMKQGKRETQGNNGIQ